MDVHEEPVGRTPPTRRRARMGHALSRVVGDSLARTRRREPWRTSRGALRAASVASQLLTGSVVTAALLATSLPAPVEGPAPRRLTLSVTRAAFVDPDGRPHALLALGGDVAAGAGARLSDVVRKEGLVSDDAVALDASGDGWRDAMAMGRRIRSAGLRAIVGGIGPDGAFLPGSCIAACAVVLAGGVDRMAMAGSTVGAGEGTAVDDGALGRDVSAYLVEMGASGLLGPILLGGGGRGLAPEEARVLGLVGATLP